MRPVCLSLALLLALVPAGLPGSGRVGGPDATVAAWLDSIAIDPGVLTELDGYAAGHGDWPADSADRLARAFRQRIRADLARALHRIASGEVADEVRVNYLSPRDFAQGRDETRDERGRDFEAGVIRTEQFYPYPGVELAPAAALARYIDPEFRRQTTSRIEEIEEANGRSCVRTGGIRGLLDPTWTCNRITLLDADSVAAEHSQLVSNPGGDGFQPVYFKESVKVFIATSEGLFLYYINYTRSSKLGALKKKLGRGRIEDSQRERAAALAEWLHGEPR